MRGESDNVIETKEGSSEAREEPRPPGGKALIRLLQALESAGLTETATATVDMAVSDDNREAVMERATQFSAAPNGETLATRSPSKAGSTRRRRSSKGRETAASDAGAAESENIAEMYAETAERLGPPTPTGPQWRSLGPLTVPNGQTYGASRVNISGRIAAVAVDPGDPAHVLVGAANGGVWESRSTG